jgi:tellurite resistance protein
MSQRHGSDEGLHHIAEQRLFDERRRALEEAFFRQREALVRQRLHERQEREAARAALARHCGIGDAALLDRLVDLGVRAATVDALLLVPLARVAWADGGVDAREREALLRAAHERGIEHGTPAYALLETWTHERPDADLAGAWRDFAAALARVLAPDERARLAGQLLGHARAVAAAAGGFLGVARVSKAEQALLDELARDLSAA